jgi:FSR family fosmidomycin resistance protein-like MFS transporter
MTSSFIRAVFLVALAHLTIELCANFLPVMYPLLLSAWGLTYTQIGVIALVAGLSSALTQPIFGHLSDRWGAQRMTILSIIWMGLIMGLVGFAWDYPSLLALVGLGALGSAAFHPAGVVLTTSRGGPKRGTAISIFSVAGNLGSAFSPMMVAVGISWLGLVGPVVLIPVALLVSLALQLQLRREAGAGVSPPVHHSAQCPQQGVITEGAKLGLALIVVSVMCRSWVQVALMTYLPEWVQSQGGSITLGGQMLALFMIAAGVGSLTGGNLSDRFGRWQVLAVSAAFLGPALWFFLQASGFWQVVWVGLTGALIGLSFPVAVVMAQETWPRGVGLASALVMGLGWAPGGMGASFTGFVADHSSLATGLQLLIFPPLLGLACALGYAALQRRSLRVAPSDLA